MPISAEPYKDKKFAEINGKRMAYLRAEIAPAGSDKLAATATGAFMYID